MVVYAALNNYWKEKREEKNYMSWVILAFAKQKLDVLMDENYNFNKNNVNNNNYEYSTFLG